MKRAAKCIRKLRTILGRVIRDIERKCSHPDEQLRLLLDIARRIFNQQRNDKNKIYLKEKRKAGLVTKPLTPPEAKGGK